jgi:hypothetical protein
VSDFAQNWARRFGLTSPQFQKLLRLVNYAVRMQVREHNEDNEDVRKAAKTGCEKVENYAKEMGLGVRWEDGLNPVFVKGQLSESLPD